MKTAILIALLTVFFSLTSVAQSDDGWFTTKINIGTSYKSSFCTEYIKTSQLYNIENHFSIGTMVGLYFGDLKLIPISSCLRIRPLGKKRFMPAILATGGYGFDVSGNKNGGGLFSTSMGIETGFLRRFNYDLTLGAEWFKKECMFSVSCGIHF
ncbi:MAG: hypothetical protein II939_11555 [Bacteroidales bacterium]|nr:hypothetical protein [Bacteroidales bacterium]